MLSATVVGFLALCCVRSSKELKVFLWQQSSQLNFMNIKETDSLLYFAKQNWHWSKVQFGSKWQFLLLNSGFCSLSTCSVCTYWSIAIIIIIIIYFSCLASWWFNCNIVQLLAVLFCSFWQECKDTQVAWLKLKCTLKYVFI